MPKYTLSCKETELSNLVTKHKAETDPTKKAKLLEEIEVLEESVDILREKEAKYSHKNMMRTQEREMQEDAFDDIRTDKVFNRISKFSKSSS